MTFIKFLIWKLKNTNSNYWIVLSLRVFIKILGVVTFISILEMSDKNAHTSYWHVLIGGLYYLLFFVQLDLFVKANIGQDLSSQNIIRINLMRWVSLIATIILICISFKTIVIKWPEKSSDWVHYFYKEIWYPVFVNNLSFIIITILIFYASAILNKNKELKQENDLTI